MTSQQIERAATHDWFVEGLGNAVMVRDFTFDAASCPR